MATLQEQALAPHQSCADRIEPPQQLLDDLASFQRVLFTNQRVSALADAVREGTVPLPDPDRALSSLEEEGKVVFERACGQCHGGPGQSTPQATPQAPPVVRFHPIASQCPRPVDTVTPARWNFKPCAPQLASNARTYEIVLSVPTVTPGGSPVGAKMRRTSSDPGRALMTGFVGGPPALDDWDKFDVPGLRGISKTAPYFHNNSAATLEEIVDHYIEFFKRVEANALPGEPVPPIATTDGVHFDRRRARRARGADCLLAKGFEFPQAEPVARLRRSIPRSSDRSVQPPGKRRLPVRGRRRPACLAMLGRSGRLKGKERAT